MSSSPVFTEFAFRDVARFVLVDQPEQSLLVPLVHVVAQGLHGFLPLLEGQRTTPILVELTEDGRGSEELLSNKLVNTEGNHKGTLAAVTRTIRVDNGVIRGRNGDARDRLGLGGVALLRVALLGVTLLRITLLRVSLLGIALLGVTLLRIALLRIALLGIALVGIHSK